MNSEIVQALKAMRLQMFSLFRGHDTEKRFSQIFAKIVIKAGYTVTVDGKVKNKFSFHDLRRSF